jgi:2'-5' RNA ligase
MALLSLRVPEDVARLLSRIDVPGEKVQRDTMHVTVLYLEDADVSATLRALETAYRVAERTKPFSVRVRELTSFPANPETGLHPIIGRIESPALHALWVACGQAFDANGVNYSKKFPVYKPHVTLSYADAPFGPVTLHDAAWVVNSLTLWGGEEGDEGLDARIPLSCRPPVAGRVALRAARVAGF